MLADRRKLGYFMIGDIPHFEVFVFRNIPREVLQKVLESRAQYRNSIHRDLIGKDGKPVELPEGSKLMKPKGTSFIRVEFPDERPILTGSFATGDLLAIHGGNLVGRGFYLNPKELEMKEVC